MKIGLRSLLTGSALVLGLALGVSEAGANVIGFSVDANGNIIVAGQIIDNEYLPGVTFEAENLSDGPDWAIAFDSSAPTGGDFDLATPGSLGNAAGASLGNILIISENSALDGDGNVAIPDDEGSKPAGTITVTFAAPIIDLGFHLIDIEDNVETEGFVMALMYGGSEVGTLTYLDLQTRDSSIKYGDNSVNWITPIAASEFDGGATWFDQAVFYFNGSGGIDTLTFASVPEPTTLLLFGTGAAVVGIRQWRRKRVRGGPSPRL